MGEKIRAALLARLHCSMLPFSIHPEGVQETAAILFTSGSESMPKAVPLTHANIMRNASDLLEVLSVRGDDRLLAMLLPFHSFGLLVGLALPAIIGIAAAYHPNPTESAALLSLVCDYTLTLFGTTPTFLEGMLARAGAGEALASLRHVFAGAEKCPDRVYKARPKSSPSLPLSYRRKRSTWLCAAAGLSPLCGVRRVVKLETIPLLGTGKVNYRELAAGV